MSKLPAAVSVAALDFIYSDANRMSEVWTAGGGTLIASYEYNGRGERVYKDVNGVEHFYVYNESGQLIHYKSPSRTQHFVWLDAMPVAVIENGIIYYIEADHLGTPRKIIDSGTGDVVWEWRYLQNPFGDVAPNEDPDGDGTTFVFDLRFPGQIYDAETGLHYNYFRDYDPNIGRYVQSDPIGLMGGVNTFAYVLSRPLVFKDDLGLNPIPLVPGPPGGWLPEPGFPMPSPTCTAQGYCYASPPEIPPYDSDCYIACRYRVQAMCFAAGQGVGRGLGTVVGGVAGIYSGGPLGGARGAKLGGRLGSWSTGFVCSQLAGAQCKKECANNVCE